MKRGNCPSQKLCNWNLRTPKPCRYPIKHLLEHSRPYTKYGPHTKQLLLLFPLTNKEEHVEQGQVRIVRVQEIFGEVLRELVITCW